MNLRLLLFDYKKNKIKQEQNEFKPGGKRERE